MRYKVRGVEIRSENAAKPGCCAGAWVLNWISHLSSTEHGLDMGCGKLRYTIPLASVLSSVTAVDSKVQVDRCQAVLGVRASVREYAARYLSNVRVCALEERHWQRDRYGVVLCSNVLSAIPSRTIRKRVVATGYERLRKGGTFLLTTQYRNSHFSAWDTDPRATRYSDGFLVKAYRGTSYYALLDSEALSTFCRSVGFSILNAGHVRELAYVLATR